MQHAECREKKHSLWEHRQGPLCPPREPEEGSSEKGLLEPGFEWELSQQRPGAWGSPGLARSLACQTSGNS